MPSNPISEYLLQIQRELRSGNATEHTHRPALKTLIESLESRVTATNEPKRVECGAPDFVVSRKTNYGPITLGHIEAKDVGKNLDEVEKSDQMKRYRGALPNLILTDYLEFRWYVEGEERKAANLAHDGGSHKLVPEKGGPEAVKALLDGFLAHKPQPIDSPKELAQRMAQLTHFIRDMIVVAFERKSESATLRDLHVAFEKALIPELPIPQFADMFAQTLAYGLFAARVNHFGLVGSFKRLGAATEIPKTNPFLRQLFDMITGTALDEEPFVGFVDDLAQLLAHTDIDAVLADFGKRTARQDPVVHFYETFLAAYDPKLRETRGVYYTPEPVVSYLVRSVDYLLKTRFGCVNGLADTATVEYEREEENGGKPKKVKATSPRVLILDPACGTGTFLYTVIDHIRAEFMRQGNAGMWSGYVRNHLLPRIFGFELLMAPYAVAHFKLGMQLAGHDLTPAQREKWAYDFSGDERLGVYLTNTLEEAERKAETLFGPLRVITQEGNAASKIKSELPILAVIGNPPYSGISANMGKWIDGLLKGKLPDGTGVASYYEVDGRPLGERKLWLQDDYVKFIRWGQWRIECTGAGILAFITNHGYLDNPTFRGMRQSLMNAFTDIYILHLHGSSKKKEKAPGGVKDENVFDIQQGVTLGIFIKEPGEVGPAKIHHTDLWGLREGKYSYLFENSLESTKWIQLFPDSPNYLFIPQGTRCRMEYEACAKITYAMPRFGLGFQTSRDDLVVAFGRDELEKRIAQFIDAKLSDADVRNAFFPEKRVADYAAGDTRQWSLPEARQLLAKSTDWKRSIHRCLYRPFDWRQVLYDKRMIDWPRPEIMGHMLSSNFCLLANRQSKEDFAVLCANVLTERKIAAVYDASSSFPLYLYPTFSEGKSDQPKLEIQTTHWPAGKGGRRPNLDPEFIVNLDKRIGLSFVSDGKGDLKKTFGPEDVFNYIYAVFHSPTYRTRYAEFLKSDFPRVPLTSDLKLFRSLCGFGAELIALHLLDSSKLAKPITRFPVKGSNLVEKGFPKYVAPGEPEPGTGKSLASGRVYMSKNDPQSGDKGQYFEGVPPEVWNFHIGGYQVCEKWLKDRRGRTLTYDDLEHYSKVVTALSETIRLMAEIDAAIPKWPIE